MEKKLVIIVAILTVLFNVFFFLHVSNSLIDKLLLDKTTVSFRFHTDEQEGIKVEFLNKINGIIHAFISQLALPIVRVRFNA